MAKRKYYRPVKATLTYKTTGHTREISCVGTDETNDNYVIVRSKGYGVGKAIVFPKEFWEMSVELPPEPRKPKRKYEKKAPVVQEPPKDDPPPPVEVPEPPPDEEPTDEFSEEDMELINGKDRISSSLTGDLTKELPHEYNARAVHEKIGANDLMKMKAHVEANFALDEGKRKMQQAKARRLLNQNLERLGAGCIPD
jgi:type IV secretory pathway VirB10-like protein